MIRGLCLSQDGLARALAGQGAYAEALRASQLSLWSLTGEFADTVADWPSVDDIRFMPEALTGMQTAMNVAAQWAAASMEPTDIRRGIDMALRFDRWMAAFRRRMNAESGRFQLGKQARPVFERGLELTYLLAQQTGSLETETVFRLMEAAQAATLTDQVLEAQSGVLPEADTLRQGMLRHRHWRLFYEDKLFRNPEADSLERAEWQEAAMQHRISERELMTRFPSDLMLSPKDSLQFSDLQREMGRLSGIWVSYLWGEQAVYVLALNGRKADFRRIKRDDHLEEQVAEFERMVRDGVFVGEKGYAIETIRRYGEISYQLFETLLAPSLAKLSSWRYDRLCIAPSGPLWNLPFAALTTERRPNIGAYDDMPYLLGEYAISQQFSASIFLQKSQPLDVAQSSWAGFAPYFATRLPSAYDISLAPLEASQGELTRVQQLLQGEAFLGTASNKSRFLERAGEFDVLHMAMHATQVPEAPGFAALVLQGEGQEPGFLSAYEIADLPLKAQLAVLSACNTATGPLELGEGTMSLGRAFRQAGVPRLVMSLWPINDRWTADLMEEFYRELTRDTDLDRALQQSTLNILAQSPSLHPHNWAPFIYAGPVQQKSAAPLWPYAILLLVAAIGGWWWKRRGVK